DFRLDEIPYEMLLKLEVTMEDFQDALKEVEPSAIREVFVEVPDVTWDEIGGLEEVKQTLREVVEWPFDHPELFKQARITPPKGILLYGPPGTGKTLVAKALAHESGVNFISIKGPELMSRYVGESERGVREIFKKAKQASPCILFFDEFDSIAPRRGGNASSDVTDKVISQLLTEMDGIEQLRGVTVLAATNRRDLIDPAVLRPGRFDALLELPFPGEEDRQAIFKVHTREKPVAQDVDYQVLARETKGMSGAEIAAVCREATMAAIRQVLRGELDHLEISAKHFAEAIRLERGWRIEQ
ncbi:MAG: AAA family ATPase, partial [Bacillota bacterium]